MSQFHEPTKQLNFIRQCLLQDKIPIGFFLSAGCPYSIKVRVDGQELPLIPDINGLTEKIQKEMGKTECNNAFQILYNHFETDGISNPNVEDILSHIRSLIKVAGNEKVRGLSREELELMDKKICEQIVIAVKRDFPKNDTPYHKLSSWINAIPRKYPVEIFTTNYDLLTEQALESLTIPYFDGFVGSNYSFFDGFAIEEDTLPSRWARLWKLHGSINWFMSSQGITRGFHPDTTKLCHVIYPSHLKYDESRTMPYLAMIDRLRKFLKQPNAVLLTCGYSFRDEHINANLSDSLKSNPTAILFALLYGEITNYPSAIELARNTSNFNLISKNEAIIGTKQGIWGERKDSSLENTGIIEWVPEKSDTPRVQIEDKNYKPVYFNIGDFPKFGDQLQEMIGSTTILEHEQNAQ
jgi:hypothetical protein